MPWLGLVIIRYFWSSYLWLFMNFHKCEVELWNIVTVLFNVLFLCLWVYFVRLLIVGFLYSYFSSLNCQFFRWHHQMGQIWYFFRSDFCTFWLILSHLDPHIPDCYESLYEKHLWLTHLLHTHLAHLFSVTSLSSRE